MADYLYSRTGNFLRGIIAISLTWALPAVADCPPGPPFHDGCPLTASELNQLAPLNSPALTGTPTINGVPLAPQITPISPQPVVIPPALTCPTKLPFVDNCPPYASQLNQIAPLNSAAFAGKMIINNAIIPPIDPGLRTGSADAGASLSGLSSTEVSAFNAAQGIFEEVASISGSISGEGGRGLGPRFNGNGCAQCHVNPATGGTSPPVNPQIALATLDGATNTIPSFITIDGPIREVRFLSDSLVHQLFTVQSRSDAPPGCVLAQPDFAPQTFSLRIPTPIFGLGLVENTSDTNLRAAQDQALASSLGITTGAFNLNSPAGTITRFGWKAQQPSLLVFAGEAYNVEMGVSNDVVPSELTTGTCEPNPTQEDTMPPAGGISDAESFAVFMRFLAPPTPQPGGYSTVSTTITAGSISNGQAQFQAVGCQACHVMNQTTAASPFTGQSNITYHPMSDFGLHNMGQDLADGITQGLASAFQFRTAPLWGAGKRLFFLHDGRTTDIYQAIMAHGSPGSEANAVISAFGALSTPNQQDILNYLRSL